MGLSNQAELERRIRNLEKCVTALCGYMTSEFSDKQRDLAGEKLAGELLHAIPGAWEDPAVLVPPLELGDPQ
jgi:hypothetical protein